MKLDNGESDEMTLGQQVYEARQAKGMTLRQLAKEVGVSAPYLSDLEHDRRNPSAETLQKLAAALDIDLALLEAATGYTRDMSEWISRNPELVALLREHRRTGRPLHIGGENCPCREHISYGDTRCPRCGSYRRSMLDDCQNCKR